MTELVVDWCSYEAAKYAVTHWHYSHTIPVPPRVIIGVWEDKKFIGVVVFSRGTNNNALKPYGLDYTEGCELTRVALSSHVSSVSAIVSRAIKMLHANNPKLRLIISYADPNHNHSEGVNGDTRRTNAEGVVQSHVPASDCDLG